MHFAIQSITYKHWIIQCEDKVRHSVELKTELKQLDIEQLTIKLKGTAWFGTVFFISDQKFTI